MSSEHRLGRQCPTCRAKRQTPAEERAAVARVSSGRTQLGVASGQSAGQLPAAVDPEVSKYLLQAPLDRARAKERPRTL
jgi:hypothetical protein